MRGYQHVRPRYKQRQRFVGDYPVGVVLEKQPRLLLVDVESRAAYPLFVERVQQRFAVDELPS